MKFNKSIQMLSINIRILTNNDYKINFKFKLLSLNKKK